MLNFNVNSGVNFGWISEWILKWILNEVWVNFSDPHFRWDFLGFAHSPKPFMRLADLVEQNATIPPQTGKFKKMTIQKIHWKFTPTTRKKITQNSPRNSAQIHLEIHWKFIRQTVFFIIRPFCHVVTHDSISRFSRNVEDLKKSTAWRRDHLDGRSGGSEVGPRLIQIA